MHHRALLCFFGALFFVLTSFAIAEPSAEVPHFISLSEFSHFLNHVETRDLYHLYDWKMGDGSLKMEAGRWQILRSGTVGNYQYVVVTNGATENGEAAERPVVFVDANAQKCYASWKQANIVRGDPFSSNDINATAAAAVDEELKISDLGLCFGDDADGNGGKNSGYHFSDATKFWMGVGLVALLTGAGACVATYHCLSWCDSEEYPDMSGSEGGSSAEEHNRILSARATSFTPHDSDGGHVAEAMENIYNVNNGIKRRANEEHDESVIKDNDGSHGFADDQGGSAAVDEIKDQAADIVKASEAAPPGQRNLQRLEDELVSTSNQPERLISKASESNQDEQQKLKRTLARIKKQKEQKALSTQISTAQKFPYLTEDAVKRRISVKAVSEEQTHDDSVEELTNLVNKAQEQQLSTGKIACVKQEGNRLTPEARKLLATLESGDSEYKSSFITLLRKTDLVTFEELKALLQNELQKQDPSASSSSSSQK